MIAGLPYDAEVKWLESTGTQYIDTGMKTTGGTSSVNSGYQVEIEYRYMHQPRNDTWVFGYWNNVPSARLYLVGYYNGYRCGAGPDNTNYWCTIFYDSNFHVAKIMNDGAYFDGVRKTTTDLSGLGAHGDHGLWLFKSEHVDTGGTRQIKYCKMWTIDNVIVRNYIPVRFTNELGQSEGAMYDRVSRKLFRNKGTGSFVIGPDVATPVMRLHFMPKPKLSAKNYVQDGLVAMWDGIENAGWGVHDSNAMTWKDLIGGKEMPNRVFFDNYACLSTNAASSVCSMPAVTSDMTMTTTLRTTDTISQHLYNFLSYGTNAFNSQGFTLCSGDDSSGGKFVAYYRDGYGSQHRVIRFLLGVSPASEHNLVMSFVYSTKTISCYVDGMFIGDGQIQDDKYVSGTRVLNFGSNVLYAGELAESTGFRQYNILLYNRALTAIEIAHNYAIDKERFNLS